MVRSHGKKEMRVESVGGPLFEMDRYGKIGVARCLAREPGSWMEAR